MAATMLAQRFVDIVNAGDTDGFLSMFLPGGYVDDWGRTFTGAAEVRRWSDVEFIGASGQLTDVTISGDATVVAVVAQWTSKQHTGPSRFVLRADGDALVSLTITAA